MWERVRGLTECGAGWDSAAVTVVMRRNFGVPTVLLGVRNFGCAVIGRKQCESLRSKPQCAHGCHLPCHRHNEVSSAWYLGVAWT